MKKFIYIWLVRLFSYFKRSKNPQDIVYLMSFAGNEYLIQSLAALARKSKRRFILLYLPQCRTIVRKLQIKGIRTIEFDNNFDFLFNKLQIVMKAKILICDNYYAFLAGCQIDHSKTHVIQIWHANGAIKTFGWEELSTLSRSKADQQRFQQVYNQFDEYFVGSTKMASVFTRSYHVEKQRMKLLGYPRTDELFNKNWQIQVSQKILAEYPLIKGKEIILYTPTYREDESGNPIMNLPPDFVQIINQLSANQRLIIKLHPHVKKFETELRRHLVSDKIIWIDDFSTNDLLLIADRLITDYSSVIFDYSLLPNAKQVLFYCYDYDEYAQQVGIQGDFKKWIPGKLVTTTSGLIHELRQPLQKSDFTTFNHLWNTMNDGHATERILEHLTEELKNR